MKGLLQGVIEEEYNRLVFQKFPALIHHTGY